MSDIKRPRTSSDSETRPKEAEADRNPYSFQSGEIRVRMRFSGGRAIEDAVSHYLAMRDNADSAMGAK